MAKDVEDQEVTLLLLGDGDFSYSVDLARHLMSAKATTVYPERALHLIATGLDSPTALANKYKDATFLLTKLKGMNQSPRGADGKILCVSVHHGVSAIFHTAATRPHNLPPAHHVIFHHPHLGTENARLHAQFLCHLFHSVARVWLSASIGWFHLTLVKGQFENWQCQKAADRHDMILVDQRPFRSTIVQNPYYQHRRHQTGKSFAARTPEGSVTYTFQQSNTPQTATPPQTATGALVAALLDLDLKRNVVEAGSSDNASEGRPFACPHCDKQFKEERSRKCHVKALHDGDKKRKRRETDRSSLHSCSLCQVKDGESGKIGPRRFKSAQALEDHNQAKHLGKHDEIKPDWHTLQEPQQLSGNEAPDVKPIGTCGICGQQFFTAQELEDHHQSFVPSDLVDAAALYLECAFCQRTFRDGRAQKQHENFCQPSTS